MPAGIIQDKVAWYAVELDFDGEGLFVARPGVAADKQGSPHFHIGPWDSAEPPAITELRPAYNRSDLLERIGARLGISAAMLPRADGSVETKALTFRSALIYSFQKQNEIANPDLYFHRQSDTGVAQLIRDTLPFYLGAISPGMIEAQGILRAKRRRLKEVDRLLVRAEGFVKNRDTEAAFLLAEARRLGFAASTVEAESLEAAADALKEVETNAVAPRSAELEPLVVAGEALNGLQCERSDIRKEIEALSLLHEDQDLVRTGINEQRRRLESLNLLPPSARGAACPLCEEERSQLPPKAEALRKSIVRLESEIGFVSRDQSDLTQLISTRRSALHAVESAIAARRNEIAKLREEDQEVRIILEKRNEAARLSGMINMFLRVASSTSSEDSRSLSLEREALVSEIEQLEEQTDLTATRGRTATFLGGIGQTITQWAREQNLEYAKGLITFDIRGPRLVSETEEGTVPFSRFGSGRNWVWYHLLGHLALHKWFSEKDRPVPRFLFLDQPSQVYFSSSAGDELEQDLQEVKEIYRWMFREVRKLSGSIQLIVTDHAKFGDDPEFMDHLVHDWWEQEALIPEGW